MPTFATRDPNNPAFWDERFEQGFIPWDRGGVPDGLRAFVATHSAMRTLIPGCGTAYELAFLLEAGWDATAIDFSPAAVAAAKAGLGKWGNKVALADFFAWQPGQPLQLIYERAFLCAMPRAVWPKVAARWAELLPPGGLLAGYFFFDDTPKGPPFGTSREALDALLQPNFECVEDAEVSDSIPVFVGKERWQVWRRR
ncbi:methyltransferase [Massilia sp. CF038]|uniref:methyltransferase n=1 Tax=Massilia sp. CF038 TaxID=1881045 RepID=UPI0009185B4C|nr:methyltransferase [Massilia sp. CF038]SHH62038.1 Thiopurine S-methyltransferase (TPMT) [Massilia sp. CF038]